MENIMTRDEMINELKVGVMQVTFTKKNGDTRIMNCTLMDEYIPQEQRSTTNESTKENATNIPVFDVDAKGWRSFIVDNVQDIVPQYLLEM
jgi:hypothetical protein